jgi:osmotically-inducible protein OsmY
MEESTMNRFTGLGLIATSALLASSASLAADFEGQSKDAWLTGKVETVFLLNSHLNGFRIDTDVDNGIVTLSGTVESDIDRDLAVTLAEGVEGVVEVENELMVDTEAEGTRNADRSNENTRSFGTWVDDATTTAAVKSRLVGNENVHGLQIDVDTRGDIVTLSGRVDTDQQRDLAEQIARNTGDVSDVRNNLVVDPE